MPETTLKPNSVLKKEARDEPKPTPMKFKLAMVFGSLFICIALIEVSLRVLGAKPQAATVLSSYFMYDPTTGWIGRPNAATQFRTTNFDVLITHDESGFRSCGLDWPLHEDHLRDVDVVWCLGDSGTWGWGVEDGTTYVDRLNQMSEGRRIYRNLGLCGYSSVQQYLLLKRQFELGIKPDHVVILFCGNDLRENLDANDQDPPRAYFTVAEGKADLRNYPVPPSHEWNLRGWLKNNSLAYNYFYFYAKSATKAVKKHFNTPQPALFRARQERYAKLSPGTTAMTEISIDKPDETDPQQIALREAYAKIKKLCDDNDVTFAPATEARNDFLPAICGAILVPLLDLSEPWRKHFANENAEPANFKTDPHYNDVGHQLLATAIHDHFEEREARSEEKLRLTSYDDE